MAYICEKKMQCEECGHYRFDEERGTRACFAKEDEETSNAASKDTERTFYIPVAYEMYGRVPVKAKSVEDAFEYAKKHLDDLPLPRSAEYVEDSFEVDDQGVAYDDQGNTY